MTSHQPNYKIFYLDCALRPDELRNNIEQAAHDLKKQGYKFDAIAFRGMSGALLAAPLALALDKTMILVRKGEDSHSMYKIEGDIGAQKYLIVDDFIGTGTTVRTIIEEIFEEMKWRTLEPQCIGILEMRQRNQRRNEKNCIMICNPNNYLSEKTMHLALPDHVVKDASRYYK